MICDKTTRLMNSIYETENSCWQWSGYISPSGYSRITINKKHIPTHRLSYEVFVDEIPNGLVIDHLCRNRACINPDHLEPVTIGENVKRGVLAKTLCKQGHKFDKQNTYIRLDTGHRICRKCSYINLWNRRHPNNRKEY
jgi:hypothetical protein